MSYWKGYYMSEKWTSKDVVEFFKEQQIVSLEPVGSDPAVLDKIMDWMNSNDPEWINLVGCMLPRRHGALLFITMLEHIWFPPDTDKNFEFLMIQLGWKHMIFFVVSVPSKFRPHIDTLAPKCGIRIADGVPMVIDHKGSSVFPIKSNNTFVLENTSDHPIYRTHFGDNKSYSFEDQMIEKIHEKSFDFSDFK
jgi:hypothetical protein